MTETIGAGGSGAYPTKEHAMQAAADRTAAEGAIATTDFQVMKFVSLLSKWQDKVEDLQSAADGQWAKFLEKHGEDLGTLRNVNDSARALAQALLDLQMQLSPREED